MKKQISILCAIFSCLTLSACGGEQDASSAVEIPEITTAASTEATVMTTAETTSAATSAETSADVTTQPVPAELPIKTLLMRDKMEAWQEGNLRTHSILDDETFPLEMHTDSLGEKCWCEISIGTEYDVIYYFDGENEYLTDCISNIRTTNLQQESSLFGDDVLPDLTEENYLGSGTETIGGKSYTYEEFQYGDEYSGLLKRRYYFDEAGNVRYQSDDDESGLYTRFTVEFTTEHDLAHFQTDVSPNAKEVSYDEFSEISNQNYMKALVLS